MELIYAQTEGGDKQSVNLEASSHFCLAVFRVVTQLGNVRCLSHLLMDDVAPIQKLLFVCSQNKIRSLTAEKLFAGVPGYQARSVGTQPGARIVVTAGHLGWADLIFCMEKSHVSRLRQRYPEALEGKRVICLHIPDAYHFMQAELIDELYSKLADHVTLPEKSSNE